MRCRGGLTAALAIACCWALGPLAAPSAAQQLELVPFGGQSFTNPYYVAAPPGDPERVFVLEGAGTIRLVKNGVTQPTPFADLSDRVLAINEEGCGECGLYSIAFAPDYAQSGLFYVFYTADTADPFFAVRVEEYRRSASDPDLADLSSRRPLLELHSDTYHSGGQVQFGPDGYLYITIGDHHEPERAQDPTSLRGKLLRIDPRGDAPGQYSIPPGNPFADGAGPNADEVYAIGLRNPYRFSFDRLSGDLALGDVGQSDWEEINFLEQGESAGANLGWPCFEGPGPYGAAPPACAPPPADARAPEFSYPHEGASSAVITGYAIRDPSLPDWQGRFIYSDAGTRLGGAIRTLRVSDAGVGDDAATGLSQIVQISLGEDACGHVYVTSFTDQVWRIEPADGELRCKLGPELDVDDRLVAGALKRRGVELWGSCDWDCRVRAEAVIRVKRARGRRPYEIRLTPREREFRAGEASALELRLGKRAVRKLRNAARRDRTALVRWELRSSTSWGGAADSEGGSTRLRLRAKPRSATGRAGR